jgi:hypothetical protein
MVCCGVAWRGVVWRGVAWYGVVWRCVALRCVVWCGMVWCGVAWCGVAWRGVVWRGMVWYDVAWRGVVRCGTLPATREWLRPAFFHAPFAYGFHRPIAPHLTPSNHPTLFPPTPSRLARRVNPFKMNHVLRNRAPLPQRLGLLP